MHYIVCFLISHVSDHISCKLPCLLTQSPLPSCVCLSTMHTSLQYKWWMPKSVSKGFSPAIGPGSSRRFKIYPITTYMQVSSRLPFTEDTSNVVKLEWALCVRELNQTWCSWIGCGVLLESSRYPRTYGRANTSADWLWHSPHIFESCGHSSNTQQSSHTSVFVYNDIQPLICPQSGT